MTVQRLPLFRSKLPTAEKLEPYLREVDENRQHSNFGPLERRFTEALEIHLITGAGSVALTANGSLGLFHALKACDTEAGALCAVPSWTYAATPAAASAAGLTPWFLDVDEDTWALDPDGVRDALAKAPGSVTAVVAVAPFGQAADIEAWDALADDTGIPVVIDAANGFDALRVGHAPSMVSLHATKAFGVGEGGFVASTNPDLIGRVRQAANHGFTGPGTAGVRGFNAKLSEVAAAVGLASLDDWPQTRDAYAALNKAYADALSDVSGLTLGPDLSGSPVTSTVNVVLPVNAGPVIEGLDSRGIEARKWWADGCHRQPAYADCPRHDLTVTERLAAHVLSLPFFLGLEAADMERVAGALREILTPCE